MKWWKKVSFWNKIKATIGSLGVGTELTLFVADSHHVWKWVTFGATFLGILITFWIEDKNNDGIVDAFQDK